MLDVNTSFTFNVAQISGDVGSTPFSASYNNCYYYNNDLYKIESVNGTNGTNAFNLANDLFNNKYYDMDVFVTVTSGNFRIESGKFIGDTILGYETIKMSAIFNYVKEQNRIKSIANKITSYIKDKSEVENVKVKDGKRIVEKYTAGAGDNLGVLQAGTYPVVGTIIQAETILNQKNTGNLK